jgi:hypothetical protein
MTPDTARRVLLNLPVQWRALVARCFRGIWGHGYAAGLKRAAAPNPYDSLLPPAQIGEAADEAPKD